MVPTSNQNIRPLGYSGQFAEDDHQIIFSELWRWRESQYIQKLKENKQAGHLLSFIKGLRFSSLLIYTIRKRLDNTGLDACWGHILHETKGDCSRESDIIIYNNGMIQQWNDHKVPVMDFRFVSNCNAKIVISCKAERLKPSTIDIDYCNALKEYATETWLVAECCSYRSLDLIKKAAHEAGYKYFLCLYCYDKQQKPILQYADWCEFIRKIDQCKNP